MDPNLEGFGVFDKKLGGGSTASTRSAAAGAAAAAEMSNRPN